MIPKIFHDISKTHKIPVIGVSSGFPLFACEGKKISISNFGDQGKIYSYQV